MQILLSTSIPSNTQIHCQPTILDATVSLQTIADTTEGSMVMVCVELTGVPTGGSECDVVVSLSAQDGPKASQFITCYSIGCNAVYIV